MFSGIVETTGTLQKIVSEQSTLHFTIAPNAIFDDAIIGDSIAVNGVCLTVTRIFSNTFEVTVVPETLRVTNLGRLAQGDVVNLERSLKMGGRLGGHFVQGHVDAIGEILNIATDGDSALLVSISLPAALRKYVVNKGYITLDGMSITVINVGATEFTVTFIPHTQHATIVHQYRKGDHINIEVDILGKYIETLLGARA